MTPTERGKIEKWYAKLYRLMWAMVWDVANSDRFYLHPDDVFSELSEELVKAILHYSDKHGEELGAILKTCLRNRCTDLQVMEYYTHREAEAGIESMDAEILGVEGVSLADRLSRPGVDELYFDLDGFLNELSDDGYYLVMEVIEPSERFHVEMELTLHRKLFVATKNHWTWEPDKRVYLRTLGWPQDRFDKAWVEVSQALLSWF